ncbi:ATP-binding protein [Fodinicurvata sp. EGI_FJ10296]|uniref:ATP-binding protein n=1 Tax=Fodinicurvata sp. EGI_FJ10296 TaxID=3231908 RepID=UPI003451341A
MAAKRSHEPDDSAESYRVEELRTLGVLDTPPDPRFERIVDLIRDTMDVPTALVTMIDADRQWFKARRGFAETETPRAWAFCDQTIRGDFPVVVTDAQEDDRFRDNPLVTSSPWIRAYAGAPIIMPSGRRLGTVAAVDTRPRAFTTRDIRFLSSLSAIVADELTLIRTAQELRDQEVKLTAIINASHDAIVVLDEHYLVTGFTPAAEAMFGWNREQMIGGSLLPLIPPDAQHRTFATTSGGRNHAAAAAHALTSGDWRRTHAMRRNGETFPVLATIGKAEPGKFTRYVMIVRDMSEILSYENRLLAKSHEAQEASRAKTLFLAHMSHELRTPLNAIIGMSDVLKDHMFGPLGDDRYVGYADSINEAGHHLLSLIEGILDLSTLEARPIKPVEEQFDLRDRIAEAVRMVAPQAQARSISIDQHCPERAPVTGDSRYCRQILINLLGNAVKFSPPDSTIEVTTRLSDDGRQWIAEVADQGIGMPKKVLLRLGEPFLQGSDREHAAGSGVGLGLAISTRLAQAMNATIDFISRENAGTRAMLSMPATFRE